MDNQHLYAGNNFQIYHHDEQKYFDRRMGSPRHYINYLAKGNVRYVTTRGTFEFKAGDFYYIPMGTAYEFYNWGRQNCEIHSCGFSLFPETRTKKFKFQNLPSQYIPEFLQIPLQRLPDTPTLVKFYGLLEKLLPHLQEDQIGSPLLESLTKMILQDPTARIPALARQCGLAESTLYVHIKKQTGKTPNEYRMDILMNEALRLLASTDLPVHMIAEQLGFCSVNYFRQQFRQHTSTYPTYYRNQRKS